MASHVEIVRAAEWKHLLQACRRYCLVLVVDEALTATRCRAPSAYQLPQYRKHGWPDLVLFGKTISTNGTAVEWEGVDMQKLGIIDEEARELAILFWQERFKDIAPAADLLTSWGTLVLAEREDWPERAQVIGRLLRDTMEGEGVTRSVRCGLNSLMYLQWKGYAHTLSPALVANAGKYISWMPIMDEVMISKDELLIKVWSIAHRKQIAAYLSSKGLELRWCSRCGFPVGAGIKAQCQRCVARQCKNCEPRAHGCPIEDMDVVDD